MLKPIIFCVMQFVSITDPKPFLSSDGGFSKNKKLFLCTATLILSWFVVSKTHTWRATLVFGSKSPLFLFIYLFIFPIPVSTHVKMNKNEHQFLLLNPGLSLREADTLRPPCASSPADQIPSCCAWLQHDLFHMQPLWYVACQLIMFDVESGERPDPIVKSNSSDGTSNRYWLHGWRSLDAPSWDRYFHNVTEAQWMLIFSEGNCPLWQ